MLLEKMEKSNMQCKLLYAICLERKGLRFGFVLEQNPDRFLYSLSSSVETSSLRDSINMISLDSDEVYSSLKTVTDIERQETFE